MVWFPADRAKWSRVQGEHLFLKPHVIFSLFYTVLTLYSVGTSYGIKSGGEFSFEPLLAVFLALGPTLHPKIGPYYSQRTLIKNLTSRFDRSRLGTAVSLSTTTKNVNTVVRRGFGLAFDYRKSWLRAFPRISAHPQWPLAEEKQKTGPPRWGGEIFHRQSSMAPAPSRGFFKLPSFFSPRLM